MTVRPAAESDTDQIIAVWLASTISGQAFLPEEHWRAQEGEIRDLLPAADVTVVDQDGDVVAFVALLGDLIGGLFTHPDHQGRGFGGALVAHARQSHDPLYVEVYEANVAARGFYTRLGFVEHERSVDEATGRAMLILQMT